ncbi:MAG: LPS export ABC transporter periplasmic protein LptC, partial [Candidatus Korobacteraceae bacterium]
MSVNIPRLRKWLAASAIVLIVIVAGTYFYGRWRVSRAVRDIPRQLGIDIKQSTEGFVLSKSEGGRTIFVVRASKAVQYAPGGRAELRDVLILVYGRQADRFDQIYGERFEYDPETGNVSAMGEVHIDLEGNAEGPVAPDQSQPLELKNPIHLQTSGLVFNQNTGLAQTRERIEFRTQQASGSARGAIYNSGDATLTLQSEVQFHAAGDDPADVRANRATITRNPYRAVLETVQVERAAGGLRSDRLTVLFRENNSVEHLIALGNVQATTKGGPGVSVRAPRADAWVTEQSLIRSAVLSGGVAFQSQSASDGNATELDGTAGRVALNFREGNMHSMTASDRVRIAQSGAQGSRRRIELIAPGMIFDVAERQVRHAVTTGSSEMVLTEFGGGRSVATAARL